MTAEVPVFTFRLSLHQFAVCLGVCDEVARRYIRSDRHGIVKKKLALERPYKIHANALDLFGVDTPMAWARLAEANLLPVPPGLQRSAA